MDKKQNVKFNKIFVAIKAIINWLQLRQVDKNSSITTDWTPLTGRHKGRLGIINWTHLEPEPIKEFHELFGNIPNDNLLQQLMYLPMTDKNDWVHVRIRQYQCFRTLHQYVHRAKLILDISICYDLRGNFQPIKIIEEMVWKPSLFSHSCTSR